MLGFSRIGLVGTATIHRKHGTPSTTANGGEEKERIFKRDGALRRGRDRYRNR